MSNYNKWDNIADSDEEEEKHTKQVQSLKNEEREDYRREQDAVEMWLKRQEVAISRAEAEPPKATPPPMPSRDHDSSGYSGGLGGGGLGGSLMGGMMGMGGMGGGSDAARTSVGLEASRQHTVQALPYRKLTKEERKVAAMLITISHFEEGCTNLDRHPQMLELMRNHRWLEEDSGTLEYLCRAHNHSMRLSGSSQQNGGRRPMDGSRESKEDARIRAMCFSGINTLAGPGRCKMTGGLLELVTMICTPETDQARDLRMKWQKKEFAKDALFDSLFPDLRQYSEANADSGWTEMWVFIALIVVLIGMILFIIYGPFTEILPLKSANLTNATAAVSSSAAAAVAQVSKAAGSLSARSMGDAAAAAAAAVAAAAGEGAAATAPGDVAAATAAAAAESQRTIEELQRQIEELKRGQATTAAAAAESAPAGGEPHSEL